MGRPREAVPLLERALGGVDRGELRPSSRAVVRYKLARALRDLGETERAVGLAREARRGLLEAGTCAADRDLLEEIDAWLVDEPPAPLLDE